MVLQREWNISPYIGVSDLAFDMSRIMIEDLLGPPVAVTYAKDIPFLQPRDYEGLWTLEEVRAFNEPRYNQTMPTVAYLEDSAVSLTFFDVHETLNLNGLYLFKGLPDRNVKELEENSQCVIHTDAGGLFFMDFGISMLDEEAFDFSESVTIFKRGQYSRFVLDGLDDGTCRLIKGRREGLDKFL